ncbi:hypothetical protein [Teredinibacter sp. KSP-S5-2]|uniref:hypothetical protein n=1 Tax=Teredinibacter sp. KSP-S5-2 TaxID=3034506 RepID=UPI0029344855|nr:hypothetical protein [Teredinibacter sp. KSP-S5-2]WNO10501.1 hypothetical protein P5V12_04880 [Teredinibacter sp. KSP-S5-2]
MNVDLNNPALLPPEIHRKFGKIKNLFFEYEFSESLVENREVIPLVRELNAYCEENRIIGIHYTRAIPESIKLNGLLSRCGREIRDTFIREHGSMFTDDELDIIRERWAIYFTSSQSDVRDGRVFFNFTESELGRAGSKYLLGLYGGEQVSMCFELDEPIGCKLASIGEPLLVRCSLEPRFVETFTDYSWGKILVSSYHYMVNRNAYRIDQDGMQNIPVKPEDIVEIKVIQN